MLDIQSFVSSLRRPRLLVQAARFGLDDYKRDRDLERLLQTDPPLRSGDAIMQLMSVESELNEKRLAQDATYSIARHIEALTAIMGEARILQATRQRVADLATIR